MFKVGKPLGHHRHKRRKVHSAENPRPWILLIAPGSRVGHEDQPDSKDESEGLKPVLDEEMRRFS